MNIIGYALRLYHRFALSYRDMQDLLHQRGREVSHGTIRKWSIGASNLLRYSPRSCASGMGRLCCRWFLK
ncbi:transposase-like protein [Deinococcus humi]|uniref:Transposase-like protein n=1 Tax=Deinococcus humi TaxID=662880 RepID=A0A7W8K113_9DEIO|nr:transposase-like protein [Deinococcus humi]